MTMRSHRWNARQRAYLAEYLVQGCPRIDLTNIHTLGFFVIAASADLSRVFHRDIKRDDVVNEILRMRVRFFRFCRYLEHPGVLYDTDDNRVTVTRAYYVHLGKEPRFMASHRTRGEPLYLPMRQIFFLPTAELADWVTLQWAFWVFGDDWGRMNTHRKRGLVGFKMIGGEHRKDNLTLPKGFRELMSKISLPANIVLNDKRQRKWSVTVEAVGVLGRQRVDLYAWQVTLYNCDYIERKVVRQRMRHSPAPNIGRSFAGILVGPTKSGDIHVWVCVDRNPLIRGKDALQLQGTWSDRVWHVRIRFGVSGKGNPRIKFQKLMKKHSIHILDIPIEWVKAIGLEPPLELFMTNGNGRRWCVGVEGRRNNYGQCYRFEPAEWRAFYLDNGLRVGDLVEFDLDDSRPGHYGHMVYKCLSTVQLSIGMQHKPQPIEEASWSRGAIWPLEDGGYSAGTTIGGQLRLWIRGTNLPFNIIKYKDGPCELICQQLTHDNFERLSRSCFGNIVKTPSIHLQDDLYFQLLLILDKESRARKSLGFKLRERVFELGPRDFSLVTGLRYSPIPPTRSISAFHNIVFYGRPDIHKDEIHEDPLIDVNYVHVVDDLEAFENYPWGRVAYDHLIESTHADHACLDHYFPSTIKRTKVAAHGYSYVLQVSAYEMIPSVGQVCARKVLGWETKIPRVGFMLPVSTETLAKNKMYSPRGLIRDMPGATSYDSPPDQFHTGLNHAKRKLCFDGPVFPVQIYSPFRRWVAQVSIVKESLSSLRNMVHSIEIKGNDPSLKKDIPSPPQHGNINVLDSSSSESSFCLGLTVKNSTKSGPLRLQ
ncbi:hypothetical protein C2S53_019297 [Perilla frutescens var. hirtella]|uniref:TF-B3 domain-containing protein n=1 Tax=Perilla frutescens var. hirtella TaxID=608512 RepID=A0AAD4IR83_PERFH|nr:hypothetical protein C2S53_019297 [Perilla frutescens var. hirtella]